MKMKNGKGYLFDPAPNGWEIYKRARNGKCIKCNARLVFPMPGMIICHQCESISYVPKYWEQNFSKHESYFKDDEES